MPWQQTSAEIAGGGGELRARVSDNWSSTLRWDVQFAGSQPRDRRKIFTHTRAVKDVTLQDATVNGSKGGKYTWKPRAQQPVKPDSTITGMPLRSDDGSRAVGLTKWLFLQPQLLNPARKANFHACWCLPF